MGLFQATTAALVGDGCITTERSGIVKVRKLMLFSDRFASRLGVASDPQPLTASNPCTFVSAFLNKPLLLGSAWFPSPRKDAQLASKSRFNSLSETTS